MMIKERAAKSNSEFISRWIKINIHKKYWFYYQAKYSERGWVKIEKFEL
jgi:hypothetical protein